MYIVLDAAAKYLLLPANGKLPSRYYSFGEYTLITRASFDKRSLINPAEAASLKPPTLPPFLS